MEAGIVGLPYIGKTMLFSALTSRGADATAAGRPNVAVANVPDPRLQLLERFVETKKVVPATLQVVDVAGLVAGASQGQGQGNRFLTHVRSVDALLHVVRCFDDASIPHVAQTIDPLRDIETVEVELILADLEQVEGMTDKARKQARTGDKAAKLRLDVIEACASALGDGIPVSRIDNALVAGEEGQAVLRSMALLTAKPVLYVANVGEADPDGSGPLPAKVRELAANRGARCVAICAKVEAELAELDAADRQEMLQAMGLHEPALAVLARAAYQLLGLQSFFTAGPKEIKAWTIRVEALAPEAAGVIHSDLERGFIRAEVYGTADLEEHGSEQAIRAAGKLRVEGKSYAVQDGDVCHFLFNV